MDQDAMVAELTAGRLNAVLDVTVPEVLPADSPLYDLPNVLLTPHVAGSLGGELPDGGGRSRRARALDPRLPFAHPVGPGDIDRSA
ncbi:hypothetical protein OG689_06980 [Kitasatospora sp. NBC_00240]|nr:hypothetical protein [Kitasatospora sp. NBC_00240]